MGVENVKKFVPDEDDQAVNIQAYLKIFWRKKYYLIVPLILSLGISIIGVKRLTPIYESYTLVSVEDRNILSRTMGQYVTSIEDQSRMRNQRFHAMLETRLRSRTFLESIVTDLGLHRAYNIRQESASSEVDADDVSEEEMVVRYLAALLGSKITIQNPNFGFFRVGVYDTDPTTAYVLARKVSAKLQEVINLDQLQGIRQAGAFSDEQLAIYKEKLESSEKELARVRREMMQAETVSNPVNADNMHIADARKRSMRAAIGRSDITLNDVRTNLAEIFDQVPSSDKISEDERIKSLEEQLVAYGEERLIVELGTSDELSAENGTFVALQQELQDRIAAVVEEEYREFSPALYPLITEYFYQRYMIDYYRSRERRLQGYIDQFRQNIERRPMLERELSRLRLEVESNRTIYQTFLQSKTSAQITEAVQNTNLGLRVSIVETAEKPFRPVKPDKLLIIVATVLFGAACGLGTILITEYVDDSFRSVDEVQKIMKLPVLGTVPKTVSSFAWERKKRGKMVLLWIVGLFVLTAILSGSLYFYARSLKMTSIGIELEDKIGE